MRDETELHVNLGDENRIACKFKEQKPNFMQISWIRSHNVIPISLTLIPISPTQELPRSKKKTHELPQDMKQVTSNLQH